MCAVPCNFGSDDEVVLATLAACPERGMAYPTKYLLHHEVLSEKWRKD